MARPRRCEAAARSVPSPPHAVRWLGDAKTWNLLSAPAFVQGVAWPPTPSPGSPEPERASVKKARSLPGSALLQWVQSILGLCPARPGFQGPHRYEKADHKHARMTELETNSRPCSTCKGRGTGEYLANSGTQLRVFNLLDSPLRPLNNHTCAGSHACGSNQRHEF